MIIDNPPITTFGKGGKVGIFIIRGWLTHNT